MTDRPLPSHTRNCRSTLIDMPSHCDPESIPGLGGRTIRDEVRDLEEKLAFLKREVARREEEDEKRSFVLAQFAGNSKLYAYQVLQPAAVGDYLQVFSPWTQRQELIRVSRLGRGTWTGPCKIAYHIRVDVLR